MSEKAETPRDEVLEYVSSLDAGDVLGTVDEYDRAIPGSRPVLILLLTVLVSGLVFITTAVYFIFVFGVYGWTWNGSTRTITTGAPFRSLSTILMVVSHVVNFSVVVGTTLHVYNVCAMWMKVSKAARATGGAEANDVGTRQAAAAQLDILVSVLKTGGAGTWLKACFRVLFLKKSHRSSPTFRLLVSAVLVAGSLLGLSYVSTVFELWLNDSTYGAYAFLYTDDPTTSANFGRGLNQTQCNYYATHYTTGWAAQYQYMTQLCGLTIATPDTFATVDGMAFPSASEGSRIISNSSTQNSIAFTHDQHAILINETASVAYTATTLGVQSSCQSITRACAPGWTPGGGSIGWDCSESGLDVIITLDTNGGIVNPNNGTVGTAPGTMTAYNLISSNEFRVAQLVRSYAYTYDADGDSGYIKNTGFVWSGGGFNAMLCSISVHDVEYDYTPSNQNDPNADDEGTYVTRNVSAASTSTTQLVANIVDFSFLWTGGVATRVDGIGLLDGNYTVAYGLEMSRELVAYAAAAYQPASAVSVTGVDQPFGSEIPLAPMVLYFLTVVFYGVFILWIGIRAYTVTVRNPDVQRAHMRLTRPLTALEHMDGKTSSKVNHATEGGGKGASTASRITRAASHRVAGELFDYMTGSI